VKNKKALFITTSGGNYAAGTPLAALNFQEPYLRAIFGFIGVTDVRFVTAAGMNQGRDEAAKSRGKAERTLDDLSISW
jgi:FMN-dependent NADH-azoreductase